MAKLRIYWPVLVTFLVSVGYILLRLFVMDWDPFLLAEPGEQYLGSPTLVEEGYDGQFALYIALDPSPKTVATRLDVPAFRYQRILLPLIGRALGLGKSDWIPWTLIATNLVAHTLGTLMVLLYIRRKGISPGFSLTYGLWVGLVAGVGLDLNEPVAFALLAGALLAWDHDKRWLSGILVSLSLFAKETSLLFGIGFLMVIFLSKQEWKTSLTLLLGGLAYALWQFWLFHTFGETGLVTGGEGASSFEWIPFNGLWRIGAIDVRVMLLYLLIFGPTILFPTIWALIASIRSLYARKDSLIAWVLFLNAALIVFLPFSTFREPLGLVRLASGLVFTALCFASAQGKQRVLRYSLFWSFFLVLLSQN